MLVKALINWSLPALLVIVAVGTTLSVKVAGVPLPFASTGVMTTAKLPELFGAPVIRPVVLVDKPDGKPVIVAVIGAAPVNCTWKSYAIVA